MIPLGQSTFTPQDIINQIAEVSLAVSWQAGTAQTEIAGLIVSVLTEHPELTDRFMSEGSALFIDGHMDASNGALTFYSQNGEITTPQELRNARLIKRMETCRAFDLPAAEKPERRGGHG